MSHDRDDITIERGVTAGTLVDPDRVGLLVKTPFDEDLIETLKSLPQRDRHWDPQREAWWVEAKHEEFAVEAVVAVFGHVKVLGREGESDYYVDRHGRAVQERLL